MREHPPSLLSGDARAKEGEASADRQSKTAFILRSGKFYVLTFRIIEWFILI